MAISKWFLCGHEGVFEKNEELAFVYAQRAASSGLATAEFALGRLIFSRVEELLTKNRILLRDWDVRSGGSTRGKGLVQ